MTKPRTRRMTRAVYEDLLAGLKGVLVLAERYYQEDKPEIQFAKGAIDRAEGRA